MVLGVGLISAIIISKKNPNYKTRLEKLRLKLEKQRLTEITLYEIPTKRIIALLIIVLILFSFNFFQENYFHQLMATQGQSQSLSVPSEAFSTSNNNNYQANGLQITQINQTYQKLSGVLMWIKIAYLCMIIGILADLEWKIVKIQSQNLTIREYNRKCYGKKTRIDWKKDDYRVKIVQKGKQKFTHNTSHFALSLIDKNQKLVLEILKRGHIFQARRSIIQMGSVLGFEPDLRIH